jgi:hypothetical protein
MARELDLGSSSEPSANSHFRGQMATSPVFPFDIDIANEKWSRLLKRADRRFFYMVINTTKITAPIIRIIKKVHRLRAANNPTNLQAAFSYFFLSTIFFPSF